MSTIYDSFSGGTIDTSKWNKFTPTGLTQTGGHIAMVGNGPWGTGLISVKSFSRISNADVKIRIASQSHGAIVIAGLQSSPSVLDFTVNHISAIYFSGGNLFYCQDGGFGDLGFPWVDSVDYELTFKFVGGSTISVYINGGGYVDQFLYSFSDPYSTYISTNVANPGVEAWLTGASYDEKTTVTDIDGNVYGTVVIGTQEWTVENLKTTRFNDGSPIPEVTVDGDWAALLTPGRCAFNNDSSNFTVYGSLYNYYAVSSGSLAPAGWHVPDDAEWTTLFNYLGGSIGCGDSLKEDGTAHWDAPNTGTNTTGFTLLGGGFRADNGVWNPVNLGFWGGCWSMTADSLGTATAPYVAHNLANMNFPQAWAKPFGWSVRCLRDSTVGLPLTYFDPSKQIYDNFDGTTIDSSKWTTFNMSGLDQTNGHIAMTGVDNWNQTGVISKKVFSTGKTKSVTFGIEMLQPFTIIALQASDSVLDYQGISVLVQPKGGVSNLNVGVSNNFVPLPAIVPMLNVPYEFTFALDGTYARIFIDGGDFTNQFLYSLPYTVTDNYASFQVYHSGVESYFTGISYEAAELSDGTAAPSHVNVGTVVSTIQGMGVDTYFDSPTKISRVDSFYTHEANRQDKRIVHRYPSFTGASNWAEFVQDGTWQKTMVVAHDFDGATAIIPRAFIDTTAEDLTHSNGTMNLNT